MALNIHTLSVVDKLILGKDLTAEMLGKSRGNWLQLSAYVVPLWVVEPPNPESLTDVAFLFYFLLFSLSSHLIRITEKDQRIGHLSSFLLSSPYPEYSLSCVFSLTHKIQPFREQLDAKRLDMHLVSVHCQGVYLPIFPTLELISPKAYRELFKHWQWETHPLAISGQRRHAIIPMLV